MPGPPCIPLPYGQLPRMQAPKEGGLLCGSLSWEKHHFLRSELQTVQVGESPFPVYLCSWRKDRQPCGPTTSGHVRGRGLTKGAGRKHSGGDRICASLSQASVRDTM